MCRLAGRRLPGPGRVGRAASATARQDQLTLYVTLFLAPLFPQCRRSRRVRRRELPWDGCVHPILLMWRSALDARRSAHGGKTPRSTTARRLRAGPGLQTRRRADVPTPYPGQPAHPTPPRPAALQPSQRPWPRGRPTLSGLDAVPSAPPFQKVGSRKFQGVIVPASALGPRFPECPSSSPISPT